jgi:hypothetical protein
MSYSVSVESGGQARDSQTPASIQEYYWFFEGATILSNFLIELGNGLFQAIYP